VKKNTREVVVEFLFNQIVCRYGCPLEIVSDQGSHFLNNLIAELLQRMSIKHRKATPYYPQANGLVKKSNGIICGIIAKVVKENRKQWDQHVGRALWAYRTVHKLPTGYMPFQLAYEIEVVMPIEL
jgi:transposase InsO family protein